MVTNVTFFINLIPDHPIGTGDIILSDYVRHNKGLNALVRDRSRDGKPFYQDDLFFSGLARSRGALLDNLDPHVEFVYTINKTFYPRKHPCAVFPELPSTNSTTWSGFSM